MTERDDETTATDLALWRRAARGDLRAQDAIYRRHSERLYREVLWPVLRDHARVADALCETFVAALPALRRFVPARGRDVDGALWAWLAQIARRKAIDELRREKRAGRLREALTQAEATTDMAGKSTNAQRVLLEGEAARERTARVDAVFGAINPRYATVLRLRLCAGWERTDCAEALEVTVPTFDVLLHRALKAFRESYVARYGREPEEES